MTWTDCVVLSRIPLTSILCEVLFFILTETCVMYRVCAEWFSGVVLCSLIITFSMRSKFIGKICVSRAWIAFRPWLIVGSIVHS